MPSRLIFMPGASGNTEFWRPVAELIAHPSEKIFIGWPGIGPTPAEDGVAGVQDFVDRTVAAIDQPTALVAQSMGGVVAILAALQRPRLVTHLVLAALSGGIDTRGLDMHDWRPPRHERTQGVEHAFANYGDNLEAKLKGLDARILLLWGAHDPISPISVGERVASLCRSCELHVIQEGDHTFAHTHASVVAPLIDGHLSGAA